MLDERRDGAVAWLTFDRPQRLNAFTANGYQELRVALQRLASDDTARAVVLTGRGRAFSAGADRSLLDPATPESERKHAGDQFFQLLDVLSSFDKPLLAAVNGVAVGFGCTLLLYCDLVLIAETARLRLPFTALGMVPEAGSSALWLRECRGQKQCGRCCPVNGSTRPPRLRPAWPGAWLARPNSWNRPLPRRH